MDTQLEVVVVPVASSPGGASAAAGRCVEKVLHVLPR
jgi:hypothetical protein